MDYSRSSNIKARREHASSRKKVKNKAGLIIFRIFIAVVLVGGFAAMGTAVGVYLGVINNAPEVTVTVRPDIYTSIIYNSVGTEIDRLKGSENRIYVTSNQIPKNLKNAFVAIEDERFYQHDGIDVQGMIRAAVTMVQTKFDRTEGASTITQQLIKNNVNKLMSNSVVTKLQEQFMAVQFEKALKESYGSKAAAKDHILEVYINTINLGHGYYGAQTASTHYFNKDVSELTLSESAVIASITQNPVKYSPDTKPDNNKVRRKMVLDKMLELSMISEGEYDEAINDNVYDRITDNEVILEEASSVHSYFIDALVSQLSEDIQNKKNVTKEEASAIIYNGGLKIYATLDERIQTIIDEAMLVDSYYPGALFKIDIQYLITVTNPITGKETNLSRKATVKTLEDVQPQIEEWKREILRPDETYTERIFVIPQPQIGMAIMDYHNGQVKAIAGGRGNKTDNRTFNRAVDAVRQPGSVFKILASYAPAIELGKIGPSTIIVDEPFSYNGHEFNNWWGKSYRGPQTVRAGIEQSMNILAVKNMVNTGIEDCFKILQRFHFTTLEEGTTTSDGRFVTDKTASAALGGLTWGVTPLEMTAAYAAIANEGFYNRPIFYTKVLDRDGKTYLDNEDYNDDANRPEEILKKSTAFILTDIMRGVITKGTGTRARFRTIDMPISGKTGTTTESKDLTFVGYTPYYAAGIWTGFDQPEPMERADQGFHLDIWRDIMEEVHRDLESRDFNRPNNVDVIFICQDSGMRANDFCFSDARGSRAVETPLIAGKAPSGYCNLHDIITIDSSTGMRASANCPGSLLKTIAGIVVMDANVTDTSYQIPWSVYHGSRCTVHSVWLQPPAVEDPADEWSNPVNNWGDQQQGPIMPSDNQTHVTEPAPDDFIIEPHIPFDNQTTEDTPSRSIIPEDQTQPADTQNQEWPVPEFNPHIEDVIVIEHNQPVVDEPSSLDDFFN